MIMHNVDEASKLKMLSTQYSHSRASWLGLVFSKGESLHSNRKEKPTTNGCQAGPGEESPIISALSPILRTTAVRDTVPSHLVNGTQMPEQGSSGQHGGPGASQCEGMLGSEDKIGKEY